MDLFKQIFCSHLNLIESYDISTKKKLKNNIQAIQRFSNLHLSIVEFFISIITMYKNINYDYFLKKEFLKS